MSSSNEPMDTGEDEPAAATPAPAESRRANPGDSNLVWVEKYRPRNLSEVLSQEHIVQTIGRLVAANKLPHLLFYGRPGTGKTSAILGIARQIYGDRYHNYVLELNASDERGIGVVRNQIKTFASTQKLFSAGFKLVVLDEADHMTKDAQNALRRIMEKYTRNTRFCLICNYVNRIIPALKSRCTQFRFGPLVKRHILGKLRSVAECENVNLTEDGLQAIIRLSRGDMRRCLHILQSTHLALGTVNEKNVYLSVGQPSREDIRSIVECLFNKSFKEAYDEITRKRVQEGFSLQDIVSNLHDYVISLGFNDTLKSFLLKRLALVQYDSSFLSQEKLQVSSVIGAFQIAKWVIMEKVRLEDVLDDLDGTS